MTGFEKDVIDRLARMETTQVAQTHLLSELNREGCAQGRTDRAALEQHRIEISKLWRYARAMQAPTRQNRTMWAGIGTVLGGVVIVVAQWLGTKWGK